MSYYYAPSPRYRTACLEALRPLGVDLLAAISDQIPVVLGTPGHRSRRAKCTSVPASA